MRSSSHVVNREGAVVEAFPGFHQNFTRLRAMQRSRLGMGGESLQHPRLGLGTLLFSRNILAIYFYVIRLFSR